MKSIGVSNFSAKKLREVLEYAKIKPAVNQVELALYRSFGSSRLGFTGAGC